MNTDEAIELYKAEYLRVNRISKDRAREGPVVIRKFLAHVGKEAFDADANDIRSYMSKLTDDGLEITTVAKHLHMLKPFYKWAWESGRFDADSYMRIKSVPPPRGSSQPKLPRPYSKKELAEFDRQLDERWPITTPERWKRYWRGSTHFRKVQPEIMRVQIEAIVALALRCGLRRHEIWNMTLDDMHYDNAYVVVRKGKGGKFREVPHTNQTRDAIFAWVELRHKLKPGHDFPWLCLAWDDIALQPMREERFNTLLGSLGSGWEYHRFRHTFGTAMLRATGRLEIVQKLMGHSSISQTLTYAQLVNDDLLRVVEKNEGAFDREVAVA